VRCDDVTIVPHEFHGFRGRVLIDKRNISEDCNDFHAIGENIVGYIERDIESTIPMREDGRAVEIPNHERDQKKRKRD
jgi:hypothetical protein